MTIQKRSIALCLILTIFTCGIYGLFWFYSILDDLYAINNQESTAVMDIVLTILTCGIYGIYLSYRMGFLLDNARIAKGLTPKESSIIFLLLSIFQLSVVNFMIIQDDLNTNFSDNDYDNNDYDNNDTNYEDYRN